MRLRTKRKHGDKWGGVCARVQSAYAPMIEPAPLTTSDNNTVMTFIKRVCETAVQYTNDVCVSINRLTSVCKIGKSSKICCYPFLCLFVKMPNCGI